MQGDTGRWVVILVAGRVKVLYAEPDGGEVLLAIRGPGDLLGEFSRSDGGPRAATVQALEPGVSYTVSDAYFTELIGRHRLADHLNRYVIAKVRQTAAHSWRLARHSAAAQLAGLLLEIIAAAGPDHRDPHTIPMSQEELARALGLARSSVAAVVASWKQRGIVDTARSRLVVADPAALCALDSGA